MKQIKATLLQTTDVHCQIHAHDELFKENGEIVYRKCGGYAHLKTLTEDLRRDNKNTLLIDTGDMFQGSLLSVKTQGEALVPILNSMGYDLILPGNWEVVYKKQQMLKLLSSLTAKVICANMYHADADGNKKDLIFDPYYIWEIEGQKIGFIGYNDPLVRERQSPAYSLGIAFTKPEENLAALVSELKDQGCGTIIVLAHIGLTQEIALSGHPSCQGVDYILGADTHERVRKPLHGTLAKVVEPGAFGSFIGKLDLYIEENRLHREEYSLLEVTSPSIEPDADMQALITELERPFHKMMNQVLGYSTLPLTRNFVLENTIDTLVTDALSWSFPAADVVLSNGFRFCPPKNSRDETGNIPVTLKDLYDMLPVDSELKTGMVRGAQLQEWLEKELNNVFSPRAEERSGGWLIKFKGMEVHFLAHEEKGKRIKKLLIGSHDVKPEESYTILACDREGDPVDTLCRIKEVQNPEFTGKYLHEVLKNYLQSHGTVNPVLRKNAVALDISHDILTQVEHPDYEFN